MTEPAAVRRPTARWPAAAAVVAAAAAVAIGVALEPQRLVGGEQRYVIPPGTAARAAAGESVEDVVPQRVDTVVGRPLVVENRDTARHVFGPFVLDPGQRWQRTFAVSGEVAMACSLFPATGFTIDVAPPPRRAPLATVLVAAWLAALTLVVAAAAGALGVALALEGERSRGGARFGTGALALLPAVVVGTAALDIVRLTRAARLGDVLAGRTPLVWAAAVAVAIAAAVVGQLAWRPDDAAARRTAPVEALGAVGLALVALALAWLPSVGVWAAGSAAVMTAGGGLLAAAVVAAARGAADGRRLGPTVALPGFVLFAAALPIGPLTPPVQALAAVPALAAGLGLVVVARRQRACGASAAAVVGAASVLVLVVAGGGLYAALLRHLNAITLPITGTPVTTSTASIARGAARWADECAACHGPDDAAAYARLDTARLLEVMTFGTPDGPDGAPGMPALMYRLDVFARGDVMNYLRSIDRPAGAGMPDGAGTADNDGPANDAGAAGDDGPANAP